MKKTIVSTLATALVVSAASTTFAATNPFSDVPADHWAYDAVSCLVSEGVVNGYIDSSFQGESTMTRRYEMAQIVAKAIAKQDTLNAQQKAQIDKLAAEFSDELANLGVRVAALENKVDNVKWNGFIRYFNQDKKTEGSSSDSNTSKVRMRLDTTYDINEHWSGFSRMEANINATNNDSSKDGSLKIDRLYAIGKYSNNTINIGRITHNNGLSMDTPFSGVEYIYKPKANGVGFQLIAGRTANNNKWENSGAGVTVWRPTITYKVNKLDMSADYTRWGNLGKGSDGNNLLGEGRNNLDLWTAKASYQFDNKWNFTAQYGHSNVNSKKSDFLNSDSMYRFIAQYGKSKLSNPGSWDVKVWYMKENSNLFKSGDAWYDKNFQGWRVTTNIVLAKNVYTMLEYMQGKKFATTNEPKTKAFYGKIEFCF